MVKKMHSSSTDGSTHSSTGDKAGKGAQGSPLANSVKESAQQIWLAGMGAFAKAQEEGSKVFESLVKEGMTLQKKTQNVAEEKLGEVSGKMSAMADTVTAKAGQNWDKLEAIFEQRTAKALHKLGVPTSKEVAALAQRVDALAAAMARMGKAAPTKKPAATATAAAQPAAKAPARAPVKRARKTAAA